MNNPIIQRKVKVVDTIRKETSTGIRVNLGLIETDLNSETNLILDLSCEQAESFKYDRTYILRISED